MVVDLASGTRYCTRQPYLEYHHRIQSWRGFVLSGGEFLVFRRIGVEWKEGYIPRVGYKRSGNWKMKNTSRGGEEWRNVARDCWVTSRRRNGVLCRIVASDMWWKQISITLLFFFFNFFRSNLRLRWSSLRSTWMNLDKTIKGRVWIIAFYNREMNQKRSIYLARGSNFSRYDEVVRACASPEFHSAFSHRLHATFLPGWCKIQTRAPLVSFLSRADTFDFLSLESTERCRQTTSSIVGG